MFFPNPYLAERIMEMRVAEALRQAEIRRLLHAAGVDTRGWASRQACWLLARLGRLLVALGHRLQQYGSPQAGSFAEQRLGEALTGNR
jgi:hypothetical protein